MNILFNASQCGLGNNGGSKTIIRCAETLESLGVECVLYAKTNNYTWHKPDLTIVEAGDFQLCDNIVAVSVWDIEDTLNSGIKKKFWYMRGWEIWVRGEDWLIQQIKKFTEAGGRIIVNSSWLVDQLKEKCGIESVLCYSGLDLDFWKSLYKYRGNRVGTMKYKKHPTKRTDLIEKLPFVFKDIISIDSGYNDEQLRDMYGSVQAWFLPTELEGFSQVGAEAGLCGSLLICNRMDSNGCKDYATDETAMRYDNWDELIECIENPDSSKVPKMQKVLKEKIGSRERNMKRFVELLND